jgi:hypothetical protein
MHSLLVILACAGRGEDPATLLAQATAAYQAQDYAGSAQLYTAAVQAGAATPLPAYNAACCYALLGRADDAFT